jgi:hypothetical protein
MDQISHDPYSNLSADDLAAQRAGGRDSLLLTAQIRKAGSDSSTQVRVRNLSSGGLMAEYSGVIASDTQVEVEVRGIGWVPGRVAWVVDGRIGVAFDVEIDPLAARKPVGGKMPAVKRVPKTALSRL